MATSKSSGQATQPTLDGIDAPKAKKNGKAIATQQSFDSLIWSACDIMRRSNAASALQYVPELTWILFLRVLDAKEQAEADAADAVGEHYTPSLKPPYRWQDWAAPGGTKRDELTGKGANQLIGFVNNELLPYLKSLREGRTTRQHIISEIISGVERVRVDSQFDLLEVLDRIDKINEVDPTHMFALSQVYEGLLLKLGEKQGDGGQFFTPRELIRAIVQVIDPKLGEKIYDPACGTGGFLAQTYEYVMGRYSEFATPEQLEALRLHTFYGREKENLIYPIALANMVLHGIDSPNIWHGNTLTGNESYGGLFRDAPSLFDVILTNPPFGGKEGEGAKTQFAFKSGATQILFLQHVIDRLRLGGRCGMVVDEGVLFKTNERAFVQTKQKLLDECNLYCIVSLPGGVFTTAGAGVKTNLLFFTKGEPTREIWYYDLSHKKMNKKQPFTVEMLEEDDAGNNFFTLLAERADSRYSWSVSRAEIEAKGYDQKAVNPNTPHNHDPRTPEEILDSIAAKNEQAMAALARLRG